MASFWQSKQYVFEAHHIAGFGKTHQICRTYFSRSSVFFDSLDKGSCDLKRWVSANHRQGSLGQRLVFVLTWTWRSTWVESLYYRKLQQFYERYFADESVLFVGKLLSCTFARFKLQQRQQHHNYTVQKQNNKNIWSACKVYFMFKYNALKYHSYVTILLKSNICVNWTHLELKSKNPLFAHRSYS